MRGLFAAIGFLTRLPVPARVFDGAASPSAQLAWYPAVGFMAERSGAPPSLSSSTAKVK